MSPRNTRFRFPAHLVVATLSLSCGHEPVDADADVASFDATDIIDDISQCDGSPFAPGFACLPTSGTSTVMCPANRYCTADQCPAGCSACPTTGYLAGVQCIPDINADVTAVCPPNRVCTVSDCPTGCVGCPEPLFCIPNGPGPDGSYTPCTPSYACGTTACSADCHAVG